MRSFGTMHPTADAPIPADLTQTLLIAASSGQAMDWYSGSTSPLTAASSGGVHMVRFSGVSILGAALNFTVNLSSTKAAVPSSGVSTDGTTGFGTPVMGSAIFQIPGGSTGFSVAGLSGGYVTAELWRKS